MRHFIVLGLAVTMLSGCAMTPLQSTNIDTMAETGLEADAATSEITSLKAWGGSMDETTVRVQYEVTRGGKKFNRDIRLTFKPVQKGTIPSPQSIEITQVAVNGKRSSKEEFLSSSTGKILLEELHRMRRSHSECYERYGWFVNSYLIGRWAHSVALPVNHPFI